MLVYVVWVYPEEQSAKLSKKYTLNLLIIYLATLIISYPVYLAVIVH